MIIGHFRDHFPRLLLTLPGTSGPLAVEFILDTGFEGYLALPGSLLWRLEAEPSGLQRSVLADGSEREGIVYSLSLIWQDEPCDVEVLVLEGNPLLGTLLLDGNHLDIEVTEGGEVIIEPLT